MLILDYDYLTFFNVVGNQVFVESFLKVCSLKRHIIITLWFKIGQKWGIKHNKTGVRQAMFLAIFEERYSDSSMGNRPKPFSATGTGLSVYHKIRRFLRRNVPDIHPENPNSSKDLIPSKRTHARQSPEDR